MLMEERVTRRFATKFLATHIIVNVV